MAHVRDRPRLRESVEITTPSGKKYRWGDDEPAPENVPSGERWSDSMPGGYETHDATLPRKSGVDYADLERLIRDAHADSGFVARGRDEVRLLARGAGYAIARPSRI